MTHKQFDEKKLPLTAHLHKARAKSKFVNLVFVIKFVLADCFVLRKPRPTQICKTLAPILTNCTMLRHLFNGTIFLAFTFGLNACNGQTNTAIQKDKVSESKIQRTVNPNF